MDRDREFYQRIGRLGGRPTWRDTLKKSEQVVKERRARLPPVLRFGSGQGLSRVAPANPQEPGQRISG